jgi:histidine decarboxylase
MMAAPRLATAIALDELRQQLHPDGPTPIGFPAATDIDYSAIADLHTGIINNLGDPESDGREPRNSKALERHVVRQLVQLFGGTIRHGWGYVTQAGSTEGNQYGIWLGREHLPDGVLYRSAAAHFSVAKAARMLGMSGAANSVTIAATDSGEMDYNDLARAAAAQPDRPAIVVATAGTTMTEAVDDIGQIHAALDDARVPARHVHVDGALSGVPLALDGGPIARLLARPARNGQRSDADSVCISGHKFFATPHINGVVLTRRRHVERVSRRIDYIDGLDTTVSGSRSGHSAVELWYAMTQIGLDGHRRRVAHSRALAAYLEQRLVAAGWTAWRHPHAFTVVLKAPPASLLTRWALATSGGWSHIICVPGLTRPTIDMFLGELGVKPGNTGRTTASIATSLVPRAASA